MLSSVGVEVQMDNRGLGALWAPKGPLRGSEMAKMVLILKKC